MTDQKDENHKKSDPVFKNILSCILHNSQTPMNYIKVDPIKFIFDNPLFFPETSQKYSKLAEQFIEAHNAPPKPVPYNNFHDGKLLPEMAQLLHDMTVNRAKKAADPTTTAAVAKELSDAINHAETPEGRKEICEAFNRDERSYTTDE